MDPSDLASLLFASDEEGPAKAQAYAQALRGQQQLGLLGQLTGDKVLGGVGQSLIQGAGRGEGMMADVAQRRQGAMLQQALAAKAQASQLERDKLNASGEMDRTKAQGDIQMGLHKYDAGEEMRRLLAQLGAKKATDKSAAAKQAFDNTESLRKELSSNPVTKQFQDVGTAYDKIKNVAQEAPSPAGDMSLVFSYMKILDPGSSVREGEYASAQNTTNVPGQILNAYNHALKGELLSPTQRSDFLGQAQKLYQAHESRYGQLADQYKGYAQKSNLNPDDVVFQLRPSVASPSGGMPSPGGGSGPSPEDAAAIQWAKANPNDPRAAKILQLHGGP